MSVDKFGRYSGKAKVQRGPPGYGFKFTPEGHFDVENKKIQNLAESDANSDAATVGYVNNKCEELQLKFRKSTDRIKLIKDYFINKNNINKLNTLFDEFQILQNIVKSNKDEIAELNKKLREHANPLGLTNYEH